MLLLESKTCGRCGGSGHHSYNQIHGTVCYGCGGRGVVLTKRGNVAQAFLNSLRRRSATELQVGDKILSEGFSCGSMNVASRWVTITQIEFGKGADFGYSGCDEPAHRITTDGGIFCGFAKSDYRKAFTAAEKKEHARLALEYQASLKANGEPRGAASVAKEVA